jgi:hypothetical protein
MIFCFGGLICYNHSLMIFLGKVIILSLKPGIQYSMNYYSV